MGMKISVHLDTALVEEVAKYASKRGLHAALDHLAAVSKEQVPLDMGPLKASCSVDVNEDGTSGTVSYDTPYACVQHERTWYRHQRGRKAKYLEDPCNDSTVQHEMAELIKSEFMSGLG